MDDASIPACRSFSPEDGPISGIRDLRLYDGRARQGSRCDRVDLEFDLDSLIQISRCSTLNDAAESEEKLSATSPILR